jgi:cell division protein FtsB
MNANHVIEQLDAIRKDVAEIRADLDSLRRRVEAIEERHERLDQGILALNREFGPGRSP